MGLFKENAPIWQPQHRKPKLARAYAETTLMAMVAHRAINLSSSCDHLLGDDGYDPAPGDCLTSLLSLGAPCRSQACLLKISVALWPDSSLLPDALITIELALPEQFLTFHLVTDGGQRMFNSLMLLAAEANGVIALRMMKLMRGGRSARREANLMVSEKISAAFEATASLVAGASGNEIVHRYRQHVAKNAKRLSGRSRNRVLKRTRRRRK